MKYIIGFLLSLSGGLEATNFVLTPAFPPQHSSAKPPKKIKNNAKTKTAAAVLAMLKYPSAIKSK